VAKNSTLRYVPAKDGIMAWDSLYLDPPHSHDPSLVYSLTYIPNDVRKDYPIAVELCVTALEESISILFASFSRLSQLYIQCPISWTQKQRYGMALIFL
jgi:hypothetical protein